MGDDWLVAMNHPVLSAIAAIEAALDEIAGVDPTCMSPGWPGPDQGRQAGRRSWASSSVSRVTSSVSRSTVATSPEAGTPSAL